MNSNRTWFGHEMRLVVVARQLQSSDEALEAGMTGALGT